MAKFLSINAKGLNSNLKRRLLFQELKKTRADVVFVQETHFTSDGNFNFLRSLYPQTYMASRDCKRAGVAILIAQHCPLQVVEVISDPGGRYLILRALYRDTPVILCNVYGPNVSQINFFKRLFTKLTRLPPAALLIGGGFQCCVFGFAGQAPPAW